jgi:hypothetical protein
MHKIEISQLILDLNSSSTVKIRKAAKFLRRKPVEGMCTHLIEAYKSVVSRYKSWETQYELIMASSAVRCIDFIPYLAEICLKNEPHDLVTSGAAMSYLRLKRKNLSDVSPIFEYLDGINYSLVTGFFYALGYDKMVPSIEEQKMLIAKSYDLGFDCDDEGYSDLRYGLAAACAGWDAPIVKIFLEECCMDGSEAVKYVALSSLKGQYVKSHHFGFL